MLRFFSRTWTYLAASLEAAFDRRADPRVEVEQAVDAARRQHQAVAEQAAAVIGNQRELEIKLARTGEQVQDLRSAARRALLLAETARAERREADAARYEEAANVIAVRLAGAEASAADLEDARARAEVAASAARHALEQNARAMQRMMAERAKLLTQIETTLLQERLNDSLRTLDALAPRGATPTFEQVRSRVDERMGRAAGLAEVRRPAIEGALLEVEQAGIEEVGRARLEALRAQLRLEAEVDSK